MKKFSLYSIFLLGIYIRCFSQSISTTYITPQQAVNYMIGSGLGIHAFNATFTGDPTQLIYFTNAGSNFPISSGVGITTGNGAFAGTKGTSDAGNSVVIGGTLDTSEDPQLFSVLPGNQFETAYLEFDFTMEDKFLNLLYSFASEEYNAYSGSATYHDQMGIFMSGPGITGTVNIGTAYGLPVSVNSINACTNKTQYINNCFGNANCITTRPGEICDFPTIGDHDIPYNGFTKKIGATYSSLICDNSRIFHMKIAIANIGDTYFDSGIFMQEGGFFGPGGPSYLTANPSPVCNGSPFTLTYLPPVTGASITNLVWSTGQSGASTRTISAIANINDPAYSVTVTAGACTIVTSTVLTVHTNSNTPPFVNGVSNTGEYIIYNAIDQNGCVSIPSFDTPNEEVKIFSPDYPSGSTFNHDNSLQQIGTFCYGANTGYIGVSTFSVNTIDNNACGFLNSTSTFTVKTICGSCYVDIYYQNRTPSNHPLPSFTKAGRLIIAGNNVDPNNPTGDVETGTADVEFKSSNIITLSPGFTAGPGFWAHIDPNTCINDCEDCCDRFTGFTHEAIPNVCSPNGDGVNDIWQVTDYEHQICAYNATSFDLTIVNRWGNTVYHISESSAGCCPFRSASPTHANGVVSSINWPANDVGDGTYSYVLTLGGCGTSVSFAGDIQVFGAGANRMANPDTIPSKDSLGMLAGTVINGEAFRPTTEGTPYTSNENNINLFPNPAKEYTTLFFKTNMFNTENEVADMQITDVLGVNTLVQKIHLNENIKISVKDFKPGSYFVKVTYKSFNFTNTLIITP